MQLAKKTHQLLGNTKHTRKIEIGWMNFYDNQVKQIRTSKGGGTRVVDMPKITKNKIY